MGTHRRVVGTGQEIHSPTETGRKQNIPEKTRNRQETDTALPGTGRYLLCVANRFQWKAFPREYGASRSIHKYFSEWVGAGFFRRIWQEGC
jgi:hypothetical protein